MFQGQLSWPKVSVLIANKETLLNMRKHDIHLFILQKTSFSSPQSDNTKELRLYLSGPAIKSAKRGKGNESFLSEIAEFWLPPQVLSVACLPTWWVSLVPTPADSPMRGEGENVSLPDISFLMFGSCRKSSTSWLLNLPFWRQSYHLTETETIKSVSKMNSSSELPKML